MKQILLGLLALLGMFTLAQTAPAAVDVSQDETLGKFLVDTDGMTLYLFTMMDTKDTSNCYDDCAAAWPPLLTTGQAVAGQGVDASLLGTAERRDGKVQVTYAGQPLYTWVKDQAPGDATGQAVGDVWYAVSLAGKPLNRRSHHPLFQKPTALKTNASKTYRPDPQLKRG